MEVRKICQWCGKPFIAQKTTTCYCSHQCSNLGYKERIRERKRQLKRSQELLQPRQAAEGQGVWTYTRQHKVPKVRIRQFNYYSKKHIDAAFAKYEVDSDLTEWYTPEEIQEKYGMTRVAIRSQVYRNNIPSKKEHGQIFYSKLHFDLSKSSEQESKTEYYTVKEAMEKFKLSRDSVYGILQFHQINREKNGRFVRFLKVEFDKVMGVRK